MLIGTDLARALDPVVFAQACGITPDPWQADLLTSAAPRALLCCSRQSGKSTTTGLIALHCSIYAPGSLIIVVSPSQNQSSELLRTIKALHASIEGAPELLGDSVLKIALANGSRILALPGNATTVRGYAGVSLVIIDEAAGAEDGLIQAVFPMLATVAHGRLIALSTPKGKRGWFYEQWAGGDPLWKRVKIVAKDCPRISPDFLAEQMKLLGPTRYAEEFECEFLDDLASAFPTDIIDRAFTTEISPLWG